MFKYLASLPWRKPIAIIYSMTTLIIIVLAFAFNRDIPDNAYHLLVATNAVILSWAYGTSTMEELKGKGNKYEGENQK